MAAISIPLNLQVITKVTKRSVSKCRTDITLKMLIQLGSAAHRNYG